MQRLEFFFRQHKVLFKRNPRQKSLRLTVKPGGIILLSANLSVSQKVVNEFLFSKKDWIDQAVEKMSELKKNVQKDHVYFLGQKYQILSLLSSRNSVELIHQNEERKLIIQMKKLCPKLERDLKKKFYHQQAQELFSELLPKLCERAVVKYSKFRIGNQKSRWGSCSSKGVISLNMRLLGAPIESIVYVLVHELCHIKHANHGPDFWGMVENVMPNYKSAQSWLKKNSELLDFF
jgi:predicted metal-dependent hydrolase